MSEIINDGLHKKKYDFFISFSMADEAIVKKFVDNMEHLHNVKCWFQIKDSRAEFIDAIMEGIESSNAFLVFLSPNSAKSSFVLDEVFHAAQWSQEHEEYTILPIVLDQNDPELSSPIYKSIKFKLARLNMLFYKGESSIDELILKIFEQTGYDVIDEAFTTSMYRHDENEDIRLKAQSEVLVDFSKEYLKQILTPESFVLDIGCAKADHILAQLKDLPYDSLLGIDKDEEQIALANAEHSSPQNTFLVCDILSEDLDDVLLDYLEEHDARAFDLITISAVLLHIADPVRLLRTLKRFLSKSGYLMIQEEDDGANVVHPRSRFYDLAFRIWEDSKESGDRFCARKIPGYLADAGYRTAKMTKCGIANVGMSEVHKEALWDIYFNYHLWLAIDDDMFYHPSSTMQLLEEYKALYEQNKEQYDLGKVFLQLGFYLYIAQR